MGAACWIAPCDIRNPTAVEEAVTRCEAEFGDIHCIILNAGIARPSTGNAKLLAATKDVFDTNLHGAIYAIAAALPHMQKRNAGHIVGISSLAAFLAVPGSGAYAASKAALNRFLESLRREFKSEKRPIAVTTICPGFIKTALTAQNRFPMPFLMELEDAVEIIYNAIQRKEKLYLFPKPMKWICRAITMLPLPLQDKLMAKAKYRKESS